MRQAVFIDEALRRYSLTVFACHFCSRQFITCAIFAEHLVDMHLVDDPILNRFLGRKSGDPIREWLNDPAPRPQDP